MKLKNKTDFKFFQLFYFFFFFLLLISHNKYEKFFIFCFCVLSVGCLSQQRLLTHILFTVG